MAETITLKGISFWADPPKLYKFAVKDSTQSMFSGTETLIVESPELFKHIRKKFGRDPSTMRIQVELTIIKYQD